MRILYILHKYNPQSLKGTEHHVRSLALGMRDAGHTVSVLCSEQTLQRPYGQTRTTTHEGIAITSIANPLGTLSPYLRSPRIDSAILNHIESFQPNVIHIHHLAGLSTSWVHDLRISTIPLLYTLHDYWALCPSFHVLRHAEDRQCLYGDNCQSCYADIVQETLQHTRYAALIPRAWVRFFSRMLYTHRHARQRMRIMQSTFNRMNVLIAPSHFLLRHIQNYLPHPAYRYSLNGIETDRFHPTPLPAEDTLQCMYIGSITPHKGVDVLIRAFTHIPDTLPVQLDVYGAFHPEHDTFHALLARISEHDTRIRFHGPVSATQSPTLYAKHHVVVVPSIWYENCPLVIQEAYASGRLVITSRFGAMEEFIPIGHSAGLSTVRDPQDLARAIIAHTNSQTLREYSKGIPVAKNQRDQIQEFITLYSDLINTHISTSKSPIQQH